MHILSIPREIRDLITNDILASTTGYLAIIPVHDTHPPRFTILEIDHTELNVHGSISLAILSTCKQFHFECSSLLWKLNTLLSWPASLMQDFHNFPVTQQHLIQHIELRVDLLSVEIWNELALRKLGTWAQRGALKSLTLNLVNGDGPSLPGLFSRTSTARRALRDHVELLREAGGTDGFLSMIGRKVTLDTKVEMQFVSILEKVSSLDEVLSDVCGAYGGKVWVDGEAKFGDIVA